MRYKSLSLRGLRLQVPGTLRWIQFFLPYVAGGWRRLVWRRLGSGLWLAGGVGTAWTAAHRTDYCLTFRGKAWEVCGRLSCWSFSLYLPSIGLSYTIENALPDGIGVLTSVIDRGIVFLWNLCSCFLLMRLLLLRFEVIRRPYVSFRGFGRRSGCSGLQQR